MKTPKKLLVLLLILLCTTTVEAQEKKANVQSGYFSVARRTSLSMWSLNQWKVNGLGLGTAFRIQFSKRLNSEWYADFIRTQYKGKVYRWDRHLTNSLMFYFRDLDSFKNQLHPFVSASVFCLDITKVEGVGPGAESLERFSFSQQFGVGTHYFITEKFDISLYAQYYNHLGNDIHIDEHDDGTIHLVEVKERISLEGHMFFVFSAGYRFGDLWGKKKQ